MNANTKNLLTERLLDIQDSTSFELRTVVHEEARNARQIALSEKNRILQEGEQKAAEMLNLGDELVDKKELRALEAELRTQRAAHDEAEQMANQTDVPSLKNALLEMQAKAEEAIARTQEKIEQLVKPREEARVEAEKIVEESKRAAYQVIEDAKKRPEMILYKKIEDGLREQLLSMVLIGKHAEALDLAGREANMALYQEIKQAAEKKSLRCKKAQQVFAEGLPRQTAIPNGAYAMILVKDLIILANQKGNEMARIAVDERGKVINGKPKTNKIWKLKGRNVARLQQQASAMA